jgi:hypothetical protein
MQSDILPNPAHHLWEELDEQGIRFNEREREAYALGKLAVLLELESRVRSSEAIGDVLDDESLKIGVVDALRDVQRSVESVLYANSVTDASVFDWYEYLLKRSGASSSDAARQGTAARGQGIGRLDQARRMAGSLAREDFQGNLEKLSAREELPSEGPV